ncbi:hypothetical protein DFH09DRAFT_1273146 [Mycena vulgaris]|nr:hypothetical protein DFH09DRAFT_1273146 [Mycena vulgaris]
METGFLCLPSEVLERILEYLLPRDIKAVISVSRRLHELAITTLLESQNTLLDPPIHCTVTLNVTSNPEAEYFDALAALQLAVFIPTIDSFHLICTGTGGTIDLARGIQRCRRLLHKFPSLREVSIDLQAYDGDLLVDWCMGDPLKRDFDALLDTIADLPALSSFRVATGWHFNTLKLFPLDARLGASPPGLLDRWKDIFLRRSMPSTAPRTPHTFLIDTPLLMLPSIYRWTISTLSSRPITALRLNMLAAPADWAVILPEIAAAVPQLAELTVLGVRLHATDLVRCVARFSKLTALTTDSVPAFSTGPSFPMIARAAEDPPPEIRPFWRNACLRNLTTLAARPDHLEALLQAHKPLPALASLCVRLELLDLNAMPTVLRMERITARLRESVHKSLPLTLDVHANISPEALMCRTLDVALWEGTRWDNAFGSIEHLRVRDYGSHSCVVLARWATLFCGATHLSLTGSGQALESSVSLLRAEVHRTCPLIRTITVGGVDYHPGDTHTSIGAVISGTTSLLDLPDDVLLLVFDDLGPELYALSRLSRRLHLLALPIYLAQEGMPDPGELCEFRFVNYPTAADALSVLSSALFLNQIKHISCHFHPSGLTSCYFHHITRLTAFLGKFPSVEAVSLSLVEFGNVDSEVNELVRQRWRIAFGGLISVILGKGCTALTIRGAPYLKPGDSEPAWPTIETTMQLSSLARENASLRSFAFHPSEGLSYSATRWMFSALRCSAISTLSVSVDSSFVLDAIAEGLPNLPELEISSCFEGLDFQLLVLLCKLPALTRLSLPLRSTLHRSVPFKERVIPLFPQLKTLIASPPFIMHFLMADNPLPALERLEIRSTTGATLPREWSIAKIILALVARGRTPAVALDLMLAHPNPTRKFNALWMAANFEAFIGDAKSWDKASTLVDTLTLRSSNRHQLLGAAYQGRPEQLGAACEDVLRAVAPRFPALRHLAVDDGTREQVPGCDAALEFVLDKCPAIETISPKPSSFETVDHGPGRFGKVPVPSAIHRPATAISPQPGEARQAARSVVP